MDNPLHYAISIAGNTFTPTAGPVSPITPDLTLRRGGITQIGTAFPEAGGAAIFVGDFSGGRPTCDPEGHLTFPTTDPSAPANKNNYILYNPKTPGMIAMQPAFNWLDPNDEGDGPMFTFLVFPHGA
jgi:hypothetical protein